MSTSQYVLGNTSQELERLIWQDRMFLRPITERLLRRAGIQEGMRVLDLGCGVGSVSFLAADLVGPSGYVLGIDQSSNAIAMAKSRARENEYHHVDFHHCTVDDFLSTESFDIAVGRYVLIFQPDPAAFIRSVCDHLRPGGIMAFHEISLHRPYQALPSYPAWETMAKCLSVGFKFGAPGWDAAGHLVELFHKAGLPCPQLFAEAPVGGGNDSSIYTWLAWVVRSLMPSILEEGTLSKEEIDIDTLEGRLRLGAVEVHAQVEAPQNICAWVTV
jgi:SAM-dependent methyltransferase